MIKDSLLQREHFSHIYNNLQRQKYKDNLSNILDNIAEISHLSKLGFYSLDSHIRTNQHMYIY